MKKNIISIIITTIICVSMTVYATVKYQASQIEYNDTPLDEVLNDLYNKVKPYSFNMITDTVNNNRYYPSIISFRSRYYKYFKATNMSKDDNVSDCYLVSWSSVKAQEININLNTEYEIFSSTDGYSYSSIVLYSKGKSTAWARCSVIITLYN